MIRQRTTIMNFGDVAALTGYTAAVSLHAHTDWSKESMHNVTPYFDRIPVVSGFARRELDDYARRNNEALDFTRVWWHPPVEARAVLESETTQIATRLGLATIVSITDHDTIGANLELQQGQANSVVPISCEWTVPFHEGFFHLGVHNLPPRRARDVFASLSRYTQDPRPGELSRRLTWLNEDPETLIVLNHPLWDLAGVGSANHVRLIRRFLAEHGDAIHALELNGYRSWRENRGVLPLQEDCPVPLISGGDRHGCAPNALLNLTTASCFGAFAREIRERRTSHILVMPEYRTSLVSRKLATATDVMQRYPGYAGRERWTDRIWYDERGLAQPLSAEWPDGGPFWVRTAMTVFLIAASRPLRPLTRMLVWCAGVSRSHDPGPVSHVGLPRAARPARVRSQSVEWTMPTDAVTPAPTSMSVDRPRGVAIVCDGIGDVIGGAFVSTIRFAELLKARGHRITFISSGSLTRRRDHEYRGMPMHRFVGPLIPWSDGQLYLGIPSAPHLRRILREEQIELVHVMVPLPLGLLAVRVSKAMGLPVVMHSHTQPENIFLNSPRFPGLGALNRRFCAYLNWLYRQADVMIYPSAFASRQFPELASRPHVVVSNGVDRERFRPTPPDGFIRRYGLPGNGRRLLYLGRLHKEKNVATLIRAVPHIRAQHPDTHLYLVGLGYEQRELQELARSLDVAPHVTFCGFVPDDDLPAAISAADVFVMPSLAELEGMAVLEAMACGKPLLVADAPYSAAADLVCDNGLLFRAGDPDHLAVQASGLLAAPMRLRAMGVRSFEMSRRFDIHESARRLEAVYQSLLGTA